MSPVGVHTVSYTHLYVYKRQDQRKAPSISPNQLDEDTVIRLIKMRSAHPAWGPKKLAVLYKSAYPESPTPSESSICLLYTSRCV